MSAEPGSSQVPDVDGHGMAMLQAIATALEGKQPQDYTVYEQRAIFSKIQEEQAQKEDGISVTEDTINTSHGEVKTYFYRPDGKEAVPFVYFIHGGGFIFGSAA